MHLRLTAQWASRVGANRARVNKATGAAVRDRLIRIRDRWAADVRVDTSHYQQTVAATEPEMTTPTSGRIQPPHEDYFVYNEYGTYRMSARPSMRQAIAAEKADFYQTIEGVIKGILG